MQKKHITQTKDKLNYYFGELNPKISRVKKEITWFLCNRISTSDVESSGRLIVIFNFGLPVRGWNYVRSFVAITHGKVVSTVTITKLTTNASVWNLWMSVTSYSKPSSSRKQWVSPFETMPKKVKLTKLGDRL